MKVAVTDAAAPIVTVQVSAEPLHAPPHAAKLEPASGVAVSVTLEPEVKLAVQVAPQLRPAGVLEILPDPVPVLLTESAKFGGATALYTTSIIAVPPKGTVALCEAMFGV